ncbi:MAG: hypothetical protein K1X72_20340 [Pyrinomonadaceae bacterium]|nr:hypothetical protein [Pyrinomonadaceae bacterium]
MDDRLRLAGFVTLLFIAIFTTDFLDKWLKFLTDENDWWNLVVAAPLLIVIITTGFLVFHIKSLIKFAFFGALCFFIFISTQTYFNPDEFKEEWMVLKQNWTEIGKYFGLMFAAMFVSVLVFLSIGAIFRYIYNLFFAASQKKNAE